MRKAALLALPLLLSGCSGFGKFIGETATLPGANPNAPQGDSENLERARGRNPQALPILAEPGNIWPDAPPPLPTLKDVVSGKADMMGGLGDPSSYYGGLTAGEAPAGEEGRQMNEGGSMSAGETEDIHTGVRVAASPKTSETFDSTQGVSPKARGTEAGRETIVIPNGDGTSTYITPEGDVSIRKDAAVGTSKTTLPH